MIACDFFTVDTIFLRRIHVLFFTRDLDPSGPPRRPDRGPRLRLGRAAARNLVWEFSDRRTPPRFLIRDNDAKFNGAFDEVLRGEGIGIVRTPIEAPKANAIAERFVGTVRRECLDRLSIANRRHLERILRTFVDHYNGHRPHRALNLAAPDRVNVVPMP